ncbi:hypothetical protein KO525_18055 [Psychrosphaera sp. B3R10]|uniref:hypothetical protein n=1 Tax=unclassified Psychrosphaera TaxID=2641570 RepID=UPI001C085EC3|nr:MULTISPECIES: hypothetical protein [unclassified Psychrosphaera]MBU2882891.1 hypothetical protein [Psychrosphaera sp. I2R16]MBU2991288.1 hypothetical protein [Psychrosphaera sp. B3R10]
MSNVMDKIETQEKNYDFKLVMILAFLLVAMSFFAVGFLYAQAPGFELLIKLLAVFGGINIWLLYYLCKKFNGVVNI